MTFSWPQSAGRRALAGIIIIIIILYTVLLLGSSPLYGPSDPKLREHVKLRARTTTLGVRIMDLIPVWKSEIFPGREICRNGRFIGLGLGCYHVAIVSLPSGRKATKKCVERKRELALLLQSKATF